MKCKNCGVNDVKFKCGVPNTTCSKTCRLEWMRKVYHIKAPLKENK